MATREREVKVTVLGDSSSGQRALSQLDDQARRTDSTFDGLGRKLTSFGKVAALGLGAAAVGVGAFLKSAVDAAEESRKVTAQTEAVIKSTGGAANVSAAQVGKYADQLAALTGIDDEVIAGGQNMLLTFTRVRNEVGAGNDIFNQATKSALNMSVALGTDLNSASMLVGKALNDPIAGLTALTRSGIQFTAQQKEQIKEMVAAGDTLGAQKIILKELEVQFGGSAEAAASGAARLKVAWGNIVEDIGARVLPTLNTAANFLAENLPTALDRTGAFIGPVVEKLGAMVAVIVENWPKIQATVTDVLTNVSAVITEFVDLVTVIWDNFGEQIVSYVQNAFHAAMEIIGGALEVIRGVIATVTALIEGDWAGVWEGIKQILAGAWEIINGIVDQAMNIMQTLISIGMELLGNIISSAFEGIVNFVASIPGRILDALGDLAGMMWDSGWGMMKAFADGIWAGLGNVLGAVRGVLSKARDLLPFSDAKTGPLKDLTLSGQRLPETFAKGILSSSAIADALSTTMGTLNLTGPGGPDFAGGGDSAGITISVTAGVIVGEGGMQELTAMIRAELLRMQRRVPTLGLA